MSKVLFACSKGSESAEFSVPYDILKRAGADLTIAKVPENAEDTSNYFVTAHGLKIIADKTIEEVLKKCEEKKLQYISITDHNTCKGYEDEIIKNNNIFSGKIVMGAEMNATLDKN